MAGVLQSMQLLPKRSYEKPFYWWCNLLNKLVVSSEWRRIIYYDLISLRSYFVLVKQNFWFSKPLGKRGLTSVCAGHSSVDDTGWRQQQQTKSSWISDYVKWFHGTQMEEKSETFPIPLGETSLRAELFSSSFFCESELLSAFLQHKEY